MYSIEYYKNKSTLENSNFSSNKKKSNARVKMRCFHQKEIIDVCSDIKSLTIDIADIQNVIYDDRLKHLISLYARINGLNIKETDSITILNNNSINLLYIYEIITCDWMINQEEVNNFEELLFNKIKELNYFIEQYEKTKSQRDKINLKNKIHLFKYLINQINDQSIIQKENKKVLKLGNGIIKDTKRTTVN